MKKYTIEWISPNSGGAMDEIEALSFSDAEQKFKDFWGDVDVKRFIINIQLQ